MAALAAGSLATESAVAVPTSPAVERTLLVKFRDDVPHVARHAAVLAAGARLINRLEAIDVDVLAVSGTDRAAARAHLLRDARVRFAVPNRRVNALSKSATNDPYFIRQFGLHSVSSVAHLSDMDIDAPEGWALRFGGPLQSIRFPRAATGPEIAIIDSGVLGTHPDIGPKLTACVQATSGSGKEPTTLATSTCPDDDGHGTHVAGIAAAITNNGEGVAGVAPDARIASCDALTYDPEAAKSSGTIADVVACINWAAARKPAPVAINMSLGTPYADPVLLLAVRTAYADGMGTLPIAASGNNGNSTNTPSYPAAYPQVVSVAATNRDDCRAYFSTHNHDVELAAPGTEVWSTIAQAGTPDYQWLMGTSMAAPHVAGVAAMLAGSQPGINAGQLRARLHKAVDDVEQPGRDDLTGFGRINLAKALTGEEPRSDQPGRVTGTVHGASGVTQVRTQPRTCLFVLVTPKPDGSGRGEYVVEDLSPGTYFLEFKGGCSAWVTVTVTAGQTTRQDVTC